MARLILCLAAAACLAAPARAATGGVPVIDPSPTCKASAEDAQDKSQMKNCIEAEQRIRKELTENWNRYSAASRAQCSGELAHAYHASYVELISCLEMANPTMMKAKTTP